jgi:hypothetical protein
LSQTSTPCSSSTPYRAARPPSRCAPSREPILPHRRRVFRELSTHAGGRAADEVDRRRAIEERALRRGEAEHYGGPAPGLTAQPSSTSRSNFSRSAGFASNRSFHSACTRCRCSGGREPVSGQDLFGVRRRGPELGGERGIAVEVEQPDLGRGVVEGADRPRATRWPRGCGRKRQEGRARAPAGAAPARPASETGASRRPAASAGGSGRRRRPAGDIEAGRATDGVAPSRASTLGAAALGGGSALAASASPYASR